MYLGDTRLSVECAMDESDAVGQREGGAPAAPAAPAVPPVSDSHTHTHFHPVQLHRDLLSQGSSP